MCPSVRHLRPWALISLLAISSSALAQSPADAPKSEEQPTVALAPEPDTVRGVFVGDEYRYPRFGLVPGLLARIGMDVVAIPSSVVNWDRTDWTLAGVTVGIATVMSIPINGVSLDARLQREMNEQFGEHPHIWSPYNDFLIWSGLWSFTGGFLLYGALMPDARYLETASLMVEAFAFAQISQFAIKFATGRSGPKDGAGLGEYGGPAGFLKYFPSGTPSGHVSTMYALLATVMTYWEDPVLNVFLTTVALVFSTTIITDNYHFFSDVLLGAAIGSASGRWVVHHRSTRFKNGPNGVPVHVLDRITIAPLALPTGGSGVALGFTFE